VAGKSCGLEHPPSVPSHAAPRCRRLRFALGGR
jgi:hypothetical protein